MRITVIAFLLMLSFQSNATHIVGGEVYYDSLGIDTLGNELYQVTFEIFRDCSGSGFDSPLDYTVFNADGTVFSVFLIPLPVPDTLAVVYDDPCVTPPTDICVERAVYVQTIALPISVDGYYIVYQRCCWANNIQNIVSPDSWGITIKTTIPGSGLVTADNNCARFNQYPPIALCSNNTLDFDHSATDIDGDSLVYSICTPKTTNISVGAQPNPEAPEPYADIPWEVGFSGASPLGAASNVTIDPQTGMMSITPSLVGTFVMAICVDEYRNGVLINSKSRTFGYRVVLCDEVSPLVIDISNTSGALIGDPSVVIEDCGPIVILLNRDIDTLTEVVQIIVSGTATEGIDFSSIPDSIIMNTGVSTDTIIVDIFYDGITEGDEILSITTIVDDICGGDPDTTIGYYTIKDYIDMEISYLDSVNFCDETEVNGQITCDVVNGVGPYFFSWNPSLSNSSTLTFPTSLLDPNLNFMSVEVFDQCGKNIQSEAIRVYLNCPLGPPNVITVNGDGINEFFIIKNLEDYDRVSLMIFNRWGNLVYETDNYQNEWKGTDMRGTELTEGTYTYVVTPESVKYIYDDVEKSQYTAHGFVHIIKDK